MKDPQYPAFVRLVRLIETLRGEKGCPWDRKQTPTTVAPYLIEEVFELVAAIESGDSRAVLEELGDVLFQVLFMCRLFQEAGQFDLEKVAGVNEEKMTRRHPHVFGNEQLDNPDKVKKRWREIKKKEKSRSSDRSLLASVPRGMPALPRAYRISERAAAAGFDWNDISGVMDKVREELQEFEKATSVNESSENDLRHVSEEFGDILFTMTNVARFKGIHPETALVDSILKFEKRFRYMEEKAGKSGRTFDSVPRGEKEQMWNEAKDAVG